MAGIMTAPRAAVSAGPVPEMAPKRTQPATATKPRPPGIGPMRRFKNFTKPREIPTRSIRNPARIKKGMARRGNLAMFAKKLVETTMIPRWHCQRKTRAVIPTLTAMGTPMKRRKKKRAKRRIPGSIRLSLSFGLPDGLLERFG